MTGATEITLTGAGRFAGRAANVTTYRVNESTTTLDLNDLQGGVGDIEFTVVEDPTRSGTVLMSGQPFRLTDPYSGAINGVMDQVSVINETGVSVTASTHMMPLVAERNVPAYSGTLGGALRFYMGLCGVTTGIQIDGLLETIPVDLPSWQNDVWQGIKKLCAIYQFEVAAVSDAIIVRQARTRDIDVDTYSNFRITTGGSQAAREVRVHNYNTFWLTNTQVYPDPESSIVDRAIIQVDASEVSVTNYPVNMWISEIDEPQQVLTLPWDNTSATSVYSVVDKDGNPVTVADWENGGGLVTLALGEDGRSVDVTVRGMSTQSRAPYRIAASSLDREYQYAALYIAADGVAFKDEIISARTGANEAMLPVDSVVEIDEPMVGNRELALSVLANALIGLSGEQTMIEATATRVNRRGDTGETVYPTFLELDAQYPTQSFAQFDALWPTQSFDQFDAYQASLVSDDFESQAFGGIAGARVPYRDSIYRIVDANSGPGTHTWTARQDSTFNDHELALDAWDPTFAQFDTFWGADITFGQFGRQPLATPLV